MTVEFAIQLLDAPVGAVRLIASKGWPAALLVGGSDDTVYVAGFHDALTDRADWNTARWDSDTSKLEGLTELLRACFEASSGGLAVSAIWAGDRVESTETVTLEDLIERISTSRMGTRTSYLVSGKN